MLPPGIPIVRDRFYCDFEPLLVQGGFVIDEPRSRHDPWRSVDPEQGLVSIKGHRQTGQAWRLIIELTEVWQRGEAGAHAWRGFSASAYEYYVVLVDFDLSAGFALDPVRHADDLPLHWHPPGHPKDTRWQAPIVAPQHLLNVTEQLIADAERHGSTVGSGQATWSMCLDYLDYLP